MNRIVLVLLLATAHAAAEDSNVLQNIDVFELEVASDPQIAPNGASVAYLRRAMDIMSDRPVSSIWVVDIDGDEHRPILSGRGSYSSPRWSPTGDRLAYVTNLDRRGPQIHVRWMDTGQTALLTNVRQSPQVITWSPDGSQLAFVMQVPAETLPLAKPPAAPKGAEWAPAVRVIEEMPYRQDGGGYVDPGYNHVFVLSAEGGTPRQLTSGNFDHGGSLSWTQDGSEILFSATRKEDAEHDPVEADIWSVRVGDGEMTQLTDRDGPDFGAVVSPGGSKIAYRGFDDKKLGYHNVNVYVMDADGSNRRNLTEDFDRSIDDVQWAGSNRSLYVQYDDRGKTHIATLSMGGEIRSVADDVGGATLGRPYTSGGFTSANNGGFAYNAGTSYRPADVGYGRGSRATRKLTNLNDDALAHKTLAEIEEITWTSSADGLEIQGWIAKPPNFDPNKKYPLVLEIHGGPFAAYGPQFSTEVQLFAAAGNVVLYTNPRGSTSYGDAFANEIHHNYPGQDYNDLMSGVDAVIAKGYVDEDQLFVTGGSGGGVLTAWIVGKTDRFKAAVVAKPVINWISFSLTADGTHFFTRYWFADMPWENPDAYWARSPLSLVGNVTTPTALLTGEADYRTPIAESEQYYQALKLRKVDTALIRIPEASHGIAARPSHLIAKVDNILAWFDRYKDNDE
ncbi:MAG: S9 family peptidase [Gammaproteobacteria bacterium]|nr:S9 family peptidase [Gammaproteobacteria bacterium]